MVGQVKFRSDVTVELVKSSASDSDLIYSARVSTQGERSRDYIDEEPERSEGLIRYLIKNKHTVPVEHTSFTFYVEAPIFITREILKHRQSSISETSGRYRVLDPVFYLPGPDRDLVQVGKTGDYNFEEGSPTQRAITLHRLEKNSEDSWENYQEMLDAGVSKEVARLALPFNIFSSLYITMNARGLSNFLSLRIEDENAAVISHPQREIEMVAQKMEEHFKEKMPLTHKYFVEYGRRPL